MKKGNELSNHVQNTIIQEIDAWIKDNIDPVTGWDSPTERDEALLKLANDLLDFAGGMKRSAEAALNSQATVFYVIFIMS